MSNDKELTQQAAFDKVLDDVEHNRNANAAGAATGTAPAKNGGTGFVVAEGGAFLTGTEPHSTAEGIVVTSWGSIEDAKTFGTREEAQKFIDELNDLVIHDLTIQKADGSVDEEAPVQIKPFEQQSAEEQLVQGDSLHQEPVYRTFDGKPPV